jgi:hypothetical protein
MTTTEIDTIVCFLVVVTAGIIFWYLLCGAIIYDRDM